MIVDNYGELMATLTIELPSQASQTEFNLKRWAELVADPKLAKIQGRIETDRFGQVICRFRKGFTTIKFQIF